MISHFQTFPIEGAKVLHYYCNASSAKQNAQGPSYETIIRALSYDLAWNDDGSLAAPALALYDRCNSDKKQAPTRKDWEQLLMDLCTTGSVPTVFLIDAVDECKSIQDIHDLLEYVRRLQGQEQMPSLSVMFSSRPQVPIPTHFKDTLQTFSAVSSQADDDMYNFSK